MLLSTEWTLVEVSAQQKEIAYPLGNQTDLFYYIKIARKPMYYLFNIVVPSFTITTLSILGLFTPFNAAGERQEKVRVFSLSFFRRQKH